MAKKESLPERLQHLQPFREFLAKIPRSDVGDLTDTSLLKRILRERLNGSTSNEAREMLKRDFDALKIYLSDRQNDPLHFVLGFLLIAVEEPEELLQPPTEVKQREERLIMDLPPKSKSRASECELSVTWKRQSFYALLYNMEDESTRNSVLAKLVKPADHAIGGPAISVRLGSVTGHKHIRFSESPVMWKRADYELKIPGAYVGVTISANHLFDESEWEPYLATLHYANSG